MFRRLPIRILALTLLGMTPSAPLPAGTPSLSVSVDRDRIYLHESFLLTLRVEGADREIGEARFEATADATFEPLGSSSDSRIHVQTVNGRTTRQESVARVLTYRVTPKAGGHFQIRSITIPAGAQTLAAAGASVEVVGVEQQDVLRLEVTASRDAVLVEEPFQIVLSVTVKQLPAPNENHDPFSTSPPPKLEIPWLSPALPQGLKGPEPSAILQAMLVSQRESFGFAINEFTVRNDPFSSPFSMNFDGFGRPTPARFKLERDAVNWDGAPAWRYRLSIGYAAEREGSHTFGPVLFKGKAITGVLEGGRPTLRDVFAVGPAVTVRIVPPPEEGRPASFVGTVGSGLSVLAKLDTQLCRQGDPLHLTLDIGGAISLSNLRAPLLSRQPDVAAAFRVYDDAVRTEPIPEGRRFLYTIRPLQAGTLELPPIAVSYFDTNDRAYRTVFTKPIPLRVEAVAQFEIGDIIDTVAQSPGRSAAIRLQTARTIPAAITVTPDGASGDEALLPLRRILWLLPGPLLVAGTAVLLWLLRHRRKWRRAFRRKRAARRAIRRLHRAGTCGEMLRAVAGFFEERFDLPATAFSPMDASEVLEEHQVSEPGARALRALLQQIFDQSFRLESPDPELLDRARHELPSLLARCAVEATPAEPS